MKNWNHNKFALFYRKIFATLIIIIEYFIVLNVQLAFKGNEVISYCKLLPHTFTCSTFLSFYTAIKSKDLLIFNYTTKKCYDNFFRQ